MRFSLASLSQMSAVTFRKGLNPHEYLRDDLFMIN